MGNGLLGGHGISALLFATRFFSIARTTAIGLTVIYIVICAFVWKYQANLIFHPDRQLHTSPADLHFAVDDIAVPMPGATETAQFLHGWWIPATRATQKTVLYLHGNDGNVSTNIGGIEPLRALGYAIFMLDYRGYGDSDGGFPSEAGVYEDAQTAWNYLVHTRGINPADVLIYGHSLGGAIAIDLATRHPDAAGLVVESSFTSIRDMAGLDRSYAWLPLDLMINQHFNSIEKVRDLRLPVLYVHGTADELVPMNMGKALFHATPSAVDFFAVPDGGHEGSAQRGGAPLETEIADFFQHGVQPHSPLAGNHPTRGHS